MIAEKVSFFYKFLKSPKRVGSVTPSSPFLAQAMLKHVNWQTTDSIVELGAGTGVFTKYIHQQKKFTCDAIIYEQDSGMRQKLKSQYPNLYYRSSAENLYNDLRELGLHNGVDYIISGLPFANFDQELRDRIIDGVVRSLKPNGLFVAFQYSKQMMDQLDLRFSRLDVSFVPLNFPPAFVYYCRK